MTSRTSAFAFKGKNEDVREIAAKLNVQKIIEGSVRKAGNKIRVTAQLINAADGYHFWSETYDRSLEDIFEIQDDIARSIANKLRANLTTEQHQSQLAKAPTENLEAYKKYLRGTQLWDRADPQQRRLALDSFKEAADLDPNFTNANAYLSMTYSFMGQTGQMNAMDAFTLANEYAAKALKNDQQSPFALSVMSFLKLYGWEWKEGLEMLMKALEINPNDPVSQLMAAEYYVLFNNTEKALEHAQKCYQLDPLSANNLGEAARHFLFAGKTKEALKLSEEALLIDPYNLVSRNIHAYALALSGIPQRALEEIQETYKLTGDFPLVLMAMAFVYTQLGEKEKAMEIVSKLEMMMKQMPEVHLDFAIALICVNIGEMEKFYEAYDHSLEKRGLWLLQFYGTIMMKPVWYDEHVVESRKKLGLPVKGKNSK